VAIVAYNRREAIATTLTKTLRELDYPALEVIVVDNASTDGTADVVAESFGEVTLIRRTENIGAPAWNDAFAIARGDWVLITDDDCYLEGDALRRAVAAAEANRAQLVSFRVRSSFDREWYFTDSYETGVLAFWGCSALVSRPLLQELGGYDPNIFIWANEVELTMRLLDRGGRHLFLPDVVAVHMKPPVPERGPFNLRGFTLNYRHWTYTAGKLLQPLDAVRVFLRLLGSVAVHARLREPEARTTLPQLLPAFVAGLRARQPVRPAVSALYRDQFASYASTLETVRSPLERLRARGDARSVEADRTARWERVWTRRRRYYPRTAAVLEVPEG
jgi:GT2 family glycosyltransferase